jgi:transcriptional regulator with XRE-family HTH domain
MVMIKNERQYRITKAQIAKFSSALDSLLEQNQLDQSVHPLLRKAEREALESQRSELCILVREYEALKAGEYSVLEVNSFEEFPQALIKARISAGLTQKELAQRLELKPQQIQRYEDTEYASVSLTRLAEISKALGIQVQNEILLHQKSSAELLKKLRNTGLDKDFVLKRFLPTSLSDASANVEVSNLLPRTATALKRVFGWSLSDLFNSTPLQLNTASLEAVRFKVSSNANEKRLTAYTVYAHYLALLLLEATPNLKKQPIPINPGQVRQDIISGYGDVTLEGVLRHVWSLGIPVLPLKDPGAFHGAFWRVDGRNVIVLKQRTKSSARWIIDLLHELWHAAQEPELPERMIVEEGDILQDRQDSLEEIKATKFGEYIQLAGRKEELIEICQNEAGGSIERLKNVLPKVANREKVSVGALANYMAYRLSLDNQDWWGTATNLQIDDIDPWTVARNVFLENVNLSVLNEVDRMLLLRAISDDE